MGLSPDSVGKTDLPRSSCQMVQGRLGQNDSQFRKFLLDEAPNSVYVRRVTVVFEPGHKNRF